MKIPKLNIGGLISDIPLIQGAMGIGVSGPKLAAAVANEGGVGMIAGVNIGFRESDFASNSLAANLRALKSQIRKARELAPRGILGVNLMVAMNHYGEMVRAAVEEGIDLIVSGAGLPLKLPEFVKNLQTRIVPIVSSGKAARIISQYWETHYGRTADMVIVEGTEAGGHLGFSRETLLAQHKPSVIELVRDVVEALNPFGERSAKKIPVIAAGGVYTGGDIAECLRSGADGVQMATRFTATDECDADVKYKQAYLSAAKDDIVIIQSPVGMPGRALNNAFIRKLAASGIEIKGCSQCLTGCNPRIAPYCISAALINAVNGNVDEGVVFVGSNVYRIDKILSVKKLIRELLDDITLTSNP
jgi:nitronate monooxygenase